MCSYGLLGALFIASSILGIDNALVVQHHGERAGAPAQFDIFESVKEKRGGGGEGKG